MKIRTFVITITLALTLAFVALGQDAAIPLKSQILLQKLEKWQKEEKAKFDALVNIKKQAVAAVLKTHLTEVTKKGDLKSANAVENEITKLTGQKPIVANTKTPPKNDKGDVKLMVKKPTDEQLVQFFENTVWELYRNGQYHIVEIIFFDVGKGERKSREEDAIPLTLNWKTENGEVLFFDYGAKKWLNFNFDQRKNTIEIGNVKFRKAN